VNAQREELEKDFFKSELIKLGFYKAPDGRQLYELDIVELQRFYIAVRLNVKING
jgi:Fur-regulated basic protein A